MHKVLDGLTAPIPVLYFEAFLLQTQRSIHCVERLMTLGNYRFRTVMAEQFEWVQPEWMDADEMVRRRQRWVLADGSGDVYAELHSI